MRRVPLTGPMLMIALAGWPLSGANAEPGSHDIPAPLQKIERSGISPEEIALDQRLTGVFPLCSELRKAGEPTLRKVGPDWVVVIPDPSHDRYVKVAVHLPADGGPPVTAWQGAGLERAIAQACAGTTQNVTDG